MIFNGEKRNGSDVLYIVLGSSVTSKLSDTGSTLSEGSAFEGKEEISSGTLLKLLSRVHRILDLPLSTNCRFEPDLA